MIKETFTIALIGLIIVTFCKLLAIVFCTPKKQIISNVKEWWRQNVCDETIFFD